MLLLPIIDDRLLGYDCKCGIAEMKWQPQAALFRLRLGQRFLIILTAPYRNGPLFKHALLSIILGPLLGFLCKLLWIFSKHLCSLFVQWMVAFGGLQHAVDNLEAVFGIEGGSPVSNDVSANVSRITLYRWMERLGFKLEFGCLEGVLSGKFDFQDKDSTSVRGAIRPDDLALPIEDVVSDECDALAKFQRLLLQHGAFLYIGKKVGENKCWDRAVRCWLYIGHGDGFLD